MMCHAFHKEKASGLRAYLLRKARPLDLDCHLMAHCYCSTALQQGGRWPQSHPEVFHGTPFQSRSQQFELGAQPIAACTIQRHGSFNAPAPTLLLTHFAQPVPMTRPHKHERDHAEALGSAEDVAATGSSVSAANNDSPSLEFWAAPCLPNLMLHFLTCAETCNPCKGLHFADLAEACEVEPATFQAFRPRRTRALDGQLP